MPQRIDRCLFRLSAPHLGVPEKTVIENYALTNKFLADSLSPEASKKLLSASGNSSMSQIAPDLARILILAEPAYLSSTLYQIDRRYGSFDHYRRQALGVSDFDVVALRARLLTE